MQMLNEEARGLLRRIVESQAHREILAINMLGHCLKFVTELDVKLRVAEDLDLSLRLFRDVQALYKDLGWQDLESAVRDRTTEVVYPESRLEFGIAHYLMHVAQEVAMESYVDCAVPQFAAIARSYVAAAPMRPHPTRFEEFCAEPENRPRAQELFQRWFAVTLTAFGRPDTRADERAVELGLRARSSAEAAQDFVERLRPFVARLGLRLPAASDLGLDVAAGIGLDP
jgi:1,2-phenylacetyl-CoA epoxidase catalytic subunit